MYHPVPIFQSFVMGMAADYDVHRTVELNAGSNVVNHAQHPALYVQCLDGLHTRVVHSKVIVSERSQHRSYVLKPVQNVGGGGVTISPACKMRSTPRNAETTSGHGSRMEDGRWVSAISPIRMDNPAVSVNDVCRRGFERKLGWFISFGCQSLQCVAHLFHLTGRVEKVGAEANAVRAVYCSADDAEALL